MPDLLEHMYCSQQINIPPNLPYILKQYAKAAIRTQPHDLLFWSAAYFRAKANNSPPPVKERLEYPPFDSPSRLSPGFLRVLHKQLGNHEYVRVEVLYEKWLGVCLVKEALDSMLRIGNIHHRVPWLKFVAIAAGHICSNLSKTMVLICEVLTDQPEGSAAWIPVDKFVDLYQFLAVLNCGPQQPNVKHVELILDSPSVRSTHVSSSVADVKEEPEPTEVVEKDSTAGLMVWQDVKPQESKSDGVQSPKAEDEPGASSEFGLEVFDDAKGPVTELVTLYPVTVESEVSENSELLSKCPIKSDMVENVGEKVLSHTSLKENADWKAIEPDWKEIEPKKYDAKGNDQPLDLDELVTEEASKSGISARSESKAKDETEAKETKETETKEVEEESIVDQGNPTEEVGDQDELKETSNKDENLSEGVGSEKEGTVDKNLEEVKTQEDESKENVSVYSTNHEFNSLESEESSDSVKRLTRHKTDSEIGVGQKVTMANFVGTRNVGYSVVEIRRGRVGDRSMDEIDTQSPKVSPTMNRLAVESDESIETQDKEDKWFWDDVPGIGPVIPEAQILAVVEYMQHWASKQQGMVGPRNINHLLCPPLDLPQPPADDESIY